MSRLPPPPSIREMMKVLIEGTNTIVMPVVTPGMASGMMTRPVTCHMFAPRSCAASMTELSILVMIE